MGLPHRLAATSAYTKLGCGTLRVRSPTPLRAPVASPCSGCLLVRSRLKTLSVLGLRICEA